MVYLASPIYLSMVSNTEQLTSTKSAIAFGSNLGNSQATLEAALKNLERSPGITLKAWSSWYKTVPIGPSQPDYLNGCALLEVKLNAQELLKTLLAIEDEFGRVRKERWGARTLDLDLLLFEDLIMETPELQVPHPRMTQRAFVLVPLAEIAADWVEPVSGEAIAKLVEKVERSGVKKQELN